jgi:hypothetical protein
VQQRGLGGKQELQGELLHNMLQNMLLAVTLHVAVKVRVQQASLKRLDSLFTWHSAEDLHSLAREL